jgi:hypothetical protein
MWMRKFFQGFFYDCDETYNLLSNEPYFMSCVFLEIMEIPRDKNSVETDGGMKFVILLQGLNNFVGNL